MSGCRNEAGRLFQILGPAAEKLLSLNLVCVSGCTLLLYGADLRDSSCSSKIPKDACSGLHGIWYRVDVEQSESEVCLLTSKLEDILREWTTVLDGQALTVWRQ